MSATTVALMGHLARHGFSLDDNLLGGALAAQAGATSLTRNVSRCTKSSAATASFILRDILTNDTDSIVWVINDSANSINVYPFVGQNINGSLNTALAVAAGGFAFFSRIQATLDWRAAAFT
jgi:hypothetical protein